MGFTICCGCVCVYFSFKNILFSSHLIKTDKKTKEFFI